MINEQNLEQTLILSGVPQRLVLEPLLFLILINDFESNIKCNFNFFADDSSLFSVVYDPNLSAFNLNDDIISISTWAHQWEIAFNPNPSKPAEEIVF